MTVFGASGITPSVEISSVGGMEIFSGFAIGGKSFKVVIHAVFAGNKRRAVGGGNIIAGAGGFFELP